MAWVVGGVGMNVGRRPYSGGPRPLIPALNRLFLNLRHAKIYATRQARLVAGELYPGPVLMPKGLLRALDPILAFAAGPARSGSAEFEESFEAMLRGRPDGPLLLALWASISGGEIAHQDLREILRLMPTPPPDQPDSKKEVLDWLRPRVGAISRCILALAQKKESKAEKNLENLACGLVLVRWLTDLPLHLAQGNCFLPLDTLKKNGASMEELAQCVHSPEIDAFLKETALWTRTLLDSGLPVCNEVGSRLARGLRASVLRSHKLLQQVLNPQRDFFRRPPVLTASQRWSCAIRAWFPVHA